MPQQPLDASPVAQKAILRKAAYRARKSLKDRQARSEQAIRRLLSLDEVQRARTSLWYVSCRSELATRWVLPDIITARHRVLVPYCTNNAAGEPVLGVWLLRDVSELVEGKWGILEPPQVHWSDPQRQVALTELDCVVLPGVAFSRSGRRLGNGHGYYDRLLAQLGRRCAVLGLCFETQLFEQIPVEPHDALVDCVITESAVYRRSASST